MWERYSSSASLAVVVTFGLLFLMQLLVANPDTGPLDKRIFVVPTLHKITEPKDLVEDEPRAKKIIVVEPPETTLPPPPVDITGGMPVSIHRPKVRKITGGGIKLGLPEGDLIPVSKVVPVYPPIAQRRGLGGYAIVEFTVTAKGTVADPRAIESSNRIFERPSVKAVSRFRYKPRVVNGEAVAVTGQRHRFTFEIED